MKIKNKVVAGVSAMSLMLATCAFQSGFTASAETVRNVTWTSSTSGNTTTYTASTYSGLGSDEVVRHSGSVSTVECRHTPSNAWNTTTINASSTVRFAGANANIYNIITGSWATSNTANTNNISSNSSVQRPATYSNFPTKYYLFYTGYIHASNTSNSPMVEKVNFYEFYV